MQNEKKIREYMTARPISIGPDASLEEAFELMGDFNLRHLPVVRDSRIVGVISERDIAHAWSAPRMGDLSVASAMTAHPYIVDPEAEMSRVLGVMASHKLGCALVRDAGGSIAGIFTTTDALRLLSSSFQEAAASARDLAAETGGGEDDDEFVTESEYYKD